MAEQFVIARNPGQGSQEAGAGAVVSGNIPELVDIFHQGSDILARDKRRTLGHRKIDLYEMCFNASDNQLARNHATQLSIFTNTIVAQRRLRKAQPQIQIDARGGHSVGEYAALVDADVLSFEEGLLMVDARARYMTEADNLARGADMHGGIDAVLKMDPVQVESIAHKLGLSVANRNAPSQTGLSGPIYLLEAAEEKIREEGGRAVRLPVSLAVHSADMKHAETKLAEYIGDGRMFNDPKENSVLLNLTGKFAVSGAEIALAMPKQVTSTVLWYPEMQVAIDHANSRVSEDGELPQVVLLEVGAKTVLNGAGMDGHFAKSHDNVVLVDFQTALESGLDPEALAA